MNHAQFSSANFYPAPGEILDSKYEVEHLLGEGGMGAVAKAMHLLRRAPVALKFMSPAVVSVPGAVERFINEGVAASQIDSDHVVKIFDVGRLPSGVPYLVMEFLEGLDLSAVLEQEGRPGLDIQRSVHFVLQALRGLQVAHAVGIVHRDMKPSNCFVITKDGEPDFVKLVDFGISKVKHEGGEKITKTNSALGTPVYMSPEQARSPRDVDLRCDIYSVGVVLYELLCGRTPFTSETGEFTEILFKIFTAEPPPLQQFARVPDALAAAVHRALLRNVDQRYASAAEMGEALAPFADSRSHHVLQRLRNYEVARTSRLSAAVTPASGLVRGADEFAVTIPPPSQDVRGAGADAMARTQVGLVDGASGVARIASSVNPPPRTDIGVSADVRAKGRKGGWIGVLVFSMIALAAGTWWLRATNDSSSTSPASIGPSTITAAPPSAPSHVVEATKVEALVPFEPAPLPSAAPPAPSAQSATVPLPRAAPSRGAAPSARPANLPTDLGGVGFH